MPGRSGSGRGSAPPAFPKARPSDAGEGSPRCALRAQRRPLRSGPASRLDQSARRASRGCPCRSIRRCGASVRRQASATRCAWEQYGQPGPIVTPHRHGPGRTFVPLPRTASFLPPLQSSQLGQPEPERHPIPCTLGSTPPQTSPSSQVHRFPPCQDHTINPYNYENKMDYIMPIDTDYQPPNLPFYLQSIAESESDH